MSKTKCLQCGKDTGRGIIGTVKVRGEILSIKDVDYRPSGDYSTELCLDGDFCSGRCLQNYVKSLHKELKKSAWIPKKQSS